MSATLADKPKGTGTGTYRAYDNNTVGLAVGRQYSPETDDKNEKLDDLEHYKLSNDSQSVLGNPHGCSWQQVAALLGAEYISLAILSFPWSFSYLGLLGGCLVTIIVQMFVIYTSYILWRFCLQNPSIKHVCDIGYILFGGRYQFFYEATMVLLIGNNIFIQALHCLVGSILLNTLTGHAICTIGFSAIIAVVCAFFTLPRTFSSISWLGWASALGVLGAVITAMVFVAIQGTPNGYSVAKGAVRYEALATTSDFIQQVQAMLNISYSLIGQITIPSFVADMKNPKDFPKALWVVSIIELILMLGMGVVFYIFAGQYTKAPAIGSLKGNYAKISYGLAIPAVIVIGVIYASVLCQFLYLRITKGTEHAPDAPKRGNTKKGWMLWISLVFGTWILAWIVAEVIPFFSDLLSVMSSLFDSFFGFIFWGMAYFHITPRIKWWRGPKLLESLLNILIICIGLFFLSVGSWTSVAAIIRDYRAGAVGSAFSCADNGVQIG